MIYVNWNFGVPEFDGLEIDFTIHSPMTIKPGIYFQLYDARFAYPGGTTGAYFGLQTNVEKPGSGGQGKGLLFSRWETRSLDDVRCEPGGWLATMLD